MQTFSVNESEIVRSIWQQETLTRGRMIGKLEERRSFTSVAQEFGIDKIVSGVWKAFQRIGTAVKKLGGSRTRKTMASGDRYIAVQGKRYRSQTADNIAQQLRTVTGRCLLWPDALIKVAYSPAFLTAAYH